METQILQRRIFRNNTGSYTVTIPKVWLDRIVKTEGKLIKEVYIEIDGCLTIRPVLEGKEASP